MKVNHASSAFHVMIKPIGPRCNLNCSYCYYLEKEDLFEDNDFVMSSEVLERFTMQYIQSQTQQVVFSWQGGEPTLLGVDFFRAALALQRKYNPQRKSILNTLQTNGTLLNNEWGVFLKENRFLVGISIDGPPDLHDCFRVSKGGYPTFSRVRQGLDILKKFGVEFNVLITVNSRNVKHPLKVYKFLRDELEVEFMQFIPIVIRNNTREGSVSGDEYGQFLIMIFDEWVRNDVGDVFIQLFDAALGSWMGLPSTLCTFSHTCGRALVLEHNGNLYSCDHYVYPDYKIGNILSDSLTDVISSVKQIEFGLTKHKAHPDECRQCSVLFACQGGCPKNRLALIDSNQLGKNFLCNAYKSFFRHIDPYMRYMANEVQYGRSASGIINYIKSKGSV